MQKKVRLLYWIVIVFFILSISCKTKTEKSLSIAVAANMSYAIKDINKLFTEKYGTEIAGSTGSSGRITGQIINGAPYDLFLSANMKFPDTLYQLGLSVKPPFVYAYGSLIIWSKYEVLDWKKEFISEKYRKIAIASAQTAPYGIAGKELLTNLSLYNSLKSKMVFGESVGQVNRYIFSEAVEAGFTSKSTMLGLPKGQKGFWYVPNDSLYGPIKQGAVVLSRSQKKAEAQQFLNFLATDTVQLLLKKYGYNPVIK